MKPKDLILYELPSVAEYIWFDWGQNLFARYTARRVSRKLARYDRRIALGKRVAEYMEDTNGTKQ